ncbi:MAG: insulinase family protein [Bacteriovoracaceae bacterium]|nr:insulinase family protein [Bacteriovoracaceae bacterium]
MLWCLCCVSLGCALRPEVSNEVIDPKSKNKIDFEKINIEITEETLSNGLKVILIPSTTTETISYQTVYGVGSRHEALGKTGSSHFLEHLLFKGTKKFPEGEFDKKVEGGGGHNNAYTTYDQTVYYDNIPASELKAVMELESDRMKSLELSDEAFQVEKKVILEERQLTYENSPMGKLYESTISSVFAGTPYEHSVIGEIADIEGVTKNEIIDFYRRYYSPENTTLVISGRFDKSKALRLVKKYYSDLENGEKFSAEKAEPSSYKLKNASLSLSLHGDSPDPLVMYAVPLSKMNLEDRAAFDLLTIILGDGKSSQLMKRYVENTGPKLARIGADYYHLEKAGALLVTGQMLPGKKISLFEEDLRSYLQNFCEEEITERELQKAKNKWLLESFKELDTNSGVADFIITMKSDYSEVENYKKLFQLFTEVNLDKVHSVCKKNLTTENGVFASVWRKHPVVKP